MINFRSIEPNDLLRQADCEAEATLGEAAARFIEQAAVELPSRVAAPGSCFELALDKESIVGEVSAAAWSGGGIFGAYHADPLASNGAVTLGAPGTLDAMLESGDSITASGIECYAPSIANIHDQIVAGWNVSCSVSLIVTRGELPIDVASQDLIVVLHGGARIGTLVNLEAGQATLLPAGPLILVASELVVLLRFELREFSARDVVRQLLRSAGHHPLFRADLPRHLDLPVTSYDGSLLESPDMFQKATLALFDDGALEQARCWWNASLTFGRAPLCADADGDLVTIRWPAPPSFGDRRLGLGGPDDLIMAIAGYVVGMTSEVTEQLIVLATRGSKADDSRLQRTFRSLGLLVPARP